MPIFLNLFLGYNSKKFFSTAKRSRSVVTRLARPRSPKKLEAGSLVDWISMRTLKKSVSTDCRHYLAFLKPMGKAKTPPNLFEGFSIEKPTI